MKISLIMMDKHYGGIQNAFVDHAIEMSRRNIPIQCIFRKGSVVDTAVLESSTSSIARIQNRFGFADPIAIRCIDRCLREFFADERQAYVISFGARATYFAGQLKRTLSRQPLSFKLAASLPNRINHKYYRFADVLIPTTAAMATVEYHRNLVTPPFSEVVPLFCRVPPINTVATKPVKNLFAAGRMVRKKGLEDLINAMCQVRLACPQIHLQIAGDGPELDRLTEVRRASGSEDCVEFLGYREDVPALIAQADMLIVPSVNEPFGIILLEGMATGTPIVTTRSHGALEILDSSMAKFADIASPASLAGAIIEAVNHPEQTFQRAENALAKFKRCYTPDAVIPQILAVLRQLN